MSEVLGFSASNTCVVTVTASRTSSSFSILRSLRSLFLPSPRCVFFVVIFGLFGQATCDWESVLVSKAFSGGFDRVLGALGFLLPPCAFCGLPILVCGRAKGWDGYASDV